MMKHLLIFALLVTLSAKGQINFINPSLEGPSGAGVAPTSWGQCFGSPDQQPGQWGINNPPTNGTGYSSFLMSGSGPGSYAEGISQQLGTCLTAGTTYTFTMDIAFSPVYNTAEPLDCYGNVAIWGGNSSCDQAQLLYASPSTTTPGWNTVTVTFTPTSNWCYVCIGNWFDTPCSGYINGMVDNISPIVPTVSNPGITITSPTTNANMPCSFLVTGTSNSLPTSLTLTGNFIGSPVNANILNPTNWQAFVSYPDNLSGSQTIIARAVFPSGIIKYDTVTFNLIDIVPDFVTTAVCEGSPTVFADSTNITSPGSIANYAWTFEPGQTSGTQNPNHTFGSSGTYNVKLVVTSNAGCVDSITKPVVVNPTAIADFTLNAGCLGIPAAFQDLSNPNGSTITGRGWSFGDGIGTSTQTSPSYNYSTAGAYNVTLILNNNFNCPDTITKPITVDPLPTAGFTATPLTGCAPLGVTFTDNSLGNGAVITNYIWDFGDGNTANTASPSNVYVNPNVYDVSLIVITQNNCSDTLQRIGYIEAYPQATAAFVASPYITTVFDPTIVFTDQSSNASIWNWSFGPNLFSSIQNPVVTFADSGSYLVTLVANNANNCPDTAQTIVRVEPVPTFYIPSGFTPNDDGVNDYFGGVGADIKNYELYIFNRWGEQIYASKDMAKPWDGRHKDTIALIDTYIYLIKTVNIKNEEKEYHGIVSLIR